MTRTFFHRLFFVWLLLIIGVALAWAARAYVVASQPLSPVSSPVVSAWQPAVQGVAVTREEPVSFESRVAATDFLPIRRPGTLAFAATSAHAAVVLDADSGTILYNREAHRHRQVASLTKLMTALIVVEQVKDLDQWVTIDDEALFVEGTRVGCPRSGYCNSERLKRGERLRVRDLLKAALMNSANDAAVALGKHVAGSQTAFTVLMNERARAMGLYDSHFCTPSGLEIDGREHECYSSAYDMARITAHALRYPILWDIMQLPAATIISADGQYQHEIFNTDALLGQYPNLIGTKTGFTPLAGYSLLAVAYDPTRRHKVVAVVLDDPTRWGTVQGMLSWAFDSYEWR